MFSGSDDVSFWGYSSTAQSHLKPHYVTPPHENDVARLGVLTNHCSWPIVTLLVENIAGLQLATNYVLCVCQNQEGVRSSTNSLARQKDRSFDQFSGVVFASVESSVI